MNRLLENGQRMLHVRFDGRSVDIPLQDLRLGAGMRDGDVRAAVARYLDVPVERFDGYAVERHPAGNWTIRPEAVFG
jgi:hypothetical protein